MPPQGGAMYILYETSGVGMLAETLPSSIVIVTINQTLVTYLLRYCVRQYFPLCEKASTTGWRLNSSS